MFKIASRILIIPSNVKVVFDDDNFIFFEGPLGRSKSNKFFPEVSVNFDEKNNSLSTHSEKNMILAGTYNSILNSMIIGVTVGFKKIIKIKGNGFKVEKKDEILYFSLGKSHFDEISIPSIISVKLNGTDTLELFSVDKQELGEFSSNLRNLRRPNPYKEKGIFFSEEEGKIKFKQRKNLGK